MQKKEGLNFANKIGVRHIDFVNQKMKVNLAAQVLSSSVADAIQFLMDSGVPGFEDAKGTILFIRKIDRIFDLLNSRTPFAKGWKRPLSFGWMEDWSNAIDDTITYLNGLTAANGVPMKNHGRKTFVKGFIITAMSIKSLSTWLLTREVNSFKYVLTYKFSQDHIELLFRCI